MTVAFQIAVNTPPWVWALLALLLWLGVRDLRPRVVAPARLAILPAVSIVMSLVPVVTAPSPLIALSAWLTAILPGVPLGALIARSRPMKVDRARVTLWLAGSWFSLGLGMTIFAIRYAMGVTAARNPMLAGDTSWLIAANAVGGMVAGVGIGWLCCLLVRYRRASHADAGAPALATAATSDR